MKSQISFSGESKCERFQPHAMKADYCIECMQLIDKHKKDAILNDEQIMAAFEYSQKGATTPSTICPRDDGLGALYLGGFRCVMDLPPSVTCVVNTAQGLEMFGPKYVNRKKEIIATNKVEFLELSWLDLEAQNILPDLEKSILFIEKARRSGGDVLVHCAQGKSRSGSLVIAYCMARFDGWNFEAAYSFVQSKRAMVKPNEGFVLQLREFASSPTLAELRQKLKQLGD